MSQPSPPSMKVVAPAVVAGSEAVVAALAVQRVVAVAAEDLVVALAGLDGVVAALAED